MKISTVLLTLYLGLFLGRAALDGVETFLTMALGLGIPTLLAYLVGNSARNDA